MAITFVGQYQFPETDNANDTGTSLTFDKDNAGVSGIASGDLVLMFANARSQSGTPAGWSITTTGGQTWTEEHDAQDTMDNALYSCFFNGTWDADPVIDLPGTAAAARLLWVWVLRGVHADIWDVTPTWATDSDTSYNIADFNTNTDGAWAFGSAGSVDNNTWTVDNSFVAPSGSGNIYWRSSGSADSSIVLCRKEIATAGAVGAFTMTQATLGADVGYKVFGAIKATSGTPLVIQDATHAHAADNLAFTQHNVLAIQDALHGHTADNQALTQHNILAIQDALHGHAADNLSLTQHNVLAIQDALHAHTADNLDLTVHEGTTLAIADALHGHTAENLTLIEHNILAIQDALHGHTAENLTLTQHNILAIADALHNHLADNVVLIPEGEEPDGEQHYVRLRRRKGRWNTHTRS